MENENQLQAEEQETEINLSEIFGALVSKLWVLIICLVAGALLGICFTAVTYTYKPIYDCQLRLFLVSTTTSNDDDSTSVDIDSTVSTALLRQSVALLDSDKFRNNVSEILSGSQSIEDYLGTDDEILDLIDAAGIADGFAYTLVSGGTYDTVSLGSSATIPDEGIETESGEIAITYVFTTTNSTIKVIVSGEEEAAVEILTRVLDAYFSPYLASYSDYFESILLDSIDNPDYETELVNPNEKITTYVKYAAIFAIVVFLIAAVVIVVIRLLDTRVKDVDDIPRLVGVPVLGTIPRLQDESEEGKNRKA